MNTFHKIRMKKFILLFAVAVLLISGECSVSSAMGEESVDQTVQQENSTEYIMLKNGSSGESVAALQQRLLDLGYSLDEVDGFYGNKTKAAVKAFQKRNGLDADGIAGKITQARLFSEDAIAAPTPVDVLNGQWPMLVNREYPLGEDFIPANLVLLKDYCEEDLVRIKYSSTQGVFEAVEALVSMLEAAREDGIGPWQISAGYRSFTDQESILNNKINSYLNRNSGWSRTRARNAALHSVAEPGTSEHHLGLAFDINAPGTEAFVGTKQCNWLHANCWDYGFIIRYQKGKESITGYTAEAWHIRYVGSEHSLIIRDQDLCLEEYLEMVQNGTIEIVDLDEN